MEILINNFYNIQCSITKITQVISFCPLFCSTALTLVDFAFIDIFMLIVWKYSSITLGIYRVASLKSLKLLVLRCVTALTLEESAFIYVYDSFREILFNNIMNIQCSTIKVMSLNGGVQGV